MSTLTRYGTYFGRVPLSMGRVHFVAPSASYTVNGRSYSASDNNDGLSPERAVRTVAQAITNATADAGEVILLLRGTHTVTATVAVSKAGLTFWGEVSSEGTVPYKPVSILTSTGTSDETVGITANNTEIGYLTIRPTTGFDGVSFPTGDAALTGVYIHDCHFDMYTPAANVQTNGINLAARATSGTADSQSITTGNEVVGVKIERCSFESDGAQGRGVKWATAHGVIKDCLFVGTSGTWATPMEYATDSDNALQENCAYLSTATMSLGISGATARTDHGVTIKDCTFHLGGGTSADAIRGFGASDVRVVNCFIGTQANGTASTTAISRVTG